MPKFNVTAEIVMVTYIRPDGYFEMSDDEVADFEDESSWSEERVRVTEGQVAFIIEGENEDQARDRAQELCNFALSFHDYNDEEWEFEDVAIISVEMIEEPMTRGRATQIVRDYLAANRSTTLTPEFVEAIEFLLALLAARPNLPIGQEVT